MNKEELMKFTKEQLIAHLLNSYDKIENLITENKELLASCEKHRFNEYLYSDYLNMKEDLNRARDINDKNQFVITELQQLLDRYKNIVDKLGGNRYE